MGLIQEFLVTNQVLLAFTRGMIFFLTGFVVLLQERRRSELTLARSLSWFGWFGIVYALADWGEVFIPIQSAYLAPQWITVLRQGEVVLSALSSLLLFIFGLKLFGDTVGWRVPAMQLFTGIGVVWAAVFLGLPQMLEGATERLVFGGNLVTRLVFALGGGLLAALATIWQRGEFERQGLHSFIPDLSLFAATLALFGIGPTMLEPLVNLSVFHGALGLIMAIVIIRLMRTFEFEKMQHFESAERLKGVLNERDRIARELHDGIIQSLYGIGLQLEVYANATATSAEGTPDRLKGILAGIDDTIRQIRNYVVDLRSPLTRLPLAEELQRILEQTTAGAPVAVETELRFSPPLPPTVQGHIVQVIREAVSNAVRHAQPTRLVLRTFRRGDKLVVSLQDNGRGFVVRETERLIEMGPAGKGLGLRHMRERSRLIGAQLRVDSVIGKGTRVQLEVPLGNGDQLEDGGVANATGGENPGVNRR